MKESHKISGAFQLAVLKSERLRILILVGAIGAAFIVRSLRTVIYPSHENVQLWLSTFAVVACFVGYEFLVLRAVNRAVKNGRDLARTTWISSIILETCLP